MYINHRIIKRELNPIFNFSYVNNILRKYFEKKILKGFQCVRGVGCIGVCVLGVRPGIQSEDQNQFFTFKVRTFWQSEVKFSVLALWLGALSSLFHNMGVGGMDVILSLYVPGVVHRCVKNVLTLNVLYTDLSSLWMSGRTHYKHVCILCPHFECREGCVGVWGVCMCVSEAFRCGT